MEKVRLPSDNLTPGQLKKQNGDVEVYSLGKPMKWRELLALPTDLRKRYLEKLRDEYRANQVMIADMLNISVHTFRKRCTDWGVKFDPSGGHINDKVRERWAEFLGQEYKPVEPKPKAAKTAPEPVEYKPRNLVPASGSMTFHGPAGDALRTMEAALRDTPCTLTITWEVEN